MKRLFGLDLPISVAQVKQDTNFVELLEQHPWLNQVCLDATLATTSAAGACAGPSCLQLNTAGTGCSLI